MSAHPAAALRIVVMGPSGCGKTTIARELARSLDLRFVEGDELHPAANVSKMRSGAPLDDADRVTWLDAIGRTLGEDGDRGVVVSCSALKRRYRDRLRELAGPLIFIQPVMSREVLAMRLAGRTGHYMPASLLDSQLAALESLAVDESGYVIDGVAALPAQIEQIRLNLFSSGR